MDDDLVTYGLTAYDFTWYEIGKESDFIARNLPQIIGEFTINRKPLRIDIISENYDITFNRISVFYDNVSLTMNDDLSYYVHHDLKYATKKSNGNIFLGIKK